MSKSTYVGLWLGVSACTFNVDVNTSVNAPAGKPDATVPHDAGTPDAEADAASPVRHAACEAALPSPLPTPPIVHSDATGRPAFDLWRELDCRTLADYPLCSSASLQATAEWPCDTCVLGADDAGVCAGGAGGCELVTTGDGQCQGCAPVAAKARACCPGLAVKLSGFDCRTWPYPANSQRGEACARHEDCQPGLMCKQGEGDPHGRCFCPETTPSKIEGFVCAESAQES